MRRYLLGLFFFCFSLFAESDSPGWIHLELGAGNYGADGHTKSALAKTVLMKVQMISELKNFIDDLEEMGHGDYRADDQYRVLFWTLDELVHRFGERGIFHVNDLCPEYATFAAEKLTEYAKNRGYSSLVIEAVPGDYTLIHSDETLSKYGKAKYTSVHLKNPEVSFYHDQIDGDQYLTSVVSREQARTVLQNLANLSENGLYFFTLYGTVFFPLEERAEFVERNLFYHPTMTWSVVPYVFPEGHVLNQASMVFHISNQ
jgi:hypothetical protein